MGHVVQTGVKFEALDVSFFDLFVAIGMSKAQARQRVKQNIRLTMSSDPFKRENGRWVVNHKLTKHWAIPLADPFMLWFDTNEESVTIRSKSEFITLRRAKRSWLDNLRNWAVGFVDWVTLPKSVFVVGEE